MRIKLIALIFGVVFGSYIVVQHGPPELRHRILDWITRLGNPIGTEALERPRPEKRQADLTKKIETNLISLERLLIIAEEAEKKKEKEGLATSTEKKPAGILEQLFGKKEQTPEEKIKAVIDETRKTVQDLQSVNQEIIDSLASSTTASAVSNSSGSIPATPSSPQPRIRRSSSPEPQPRPAQPTPASLPTTLTDDQCRKLCGN